MKPNKRKGFAVLIIAVIIIAVSAVGIYLVYQTFFAQEEIAPNQLSVISGCKLISPVWAYYKCERRSADPFVTSTFPMPGSILVNIQWFKDPTLYCNQADIIDLGSQTCTYRVASVTNNQNPIYYKICSGEPCNFGYDIFGAKICSGYSGTLTSGQTIKTYYGSVISFCWQASFSSSSFTMEKTFPQKQLIKHTWSGYEAIVKGVGCDVRSVLSESEWSQLPKDAKTSLALDERQNYVESFIELPIIGNYFTHQTYGDVVCTPQHQLFKINLYSSAVSPTDEGKYTTTGGSCYYTTEANPIASVDCCPGETLAGKTCDNQGHWVNLDKGQCVRGGIASVQLCPGAGSPYCDMSTRSVLQYRCNENTGNCDIVSSQTVSCCPNSNSGCQADEFCNSNYQCEKKPTGVQACPGECCANSQYYQDKACPSGKTCCITGSGYGECKDSCSGITPPINPPDDEILKNCFDKVNEEHKFDIFGFITVPIAKLWCWIELKKTEIVVGIIAATIIALIVSLLFGHLFGLIAGIVIFVLTLMNIWIGIAAIIIVFLILIGLIIL